MELEKTIETKILQFLNDIPNAFAFKIQTTGIFDPKTRRFRKIVNPFIWKGTSDVFCCFNSRMICFEIKRPKPNKTYATKEQKEFLAHIEESGGYGFVVRSVDEVKEIMGNLCLEILEDKETETQAKKC
tara:strand:+ start:428 stop:814 length:387 start_codon:yes stop_codon:yes gene_type:complete